MFKILALQTVLKLARLDLGSERIMPYDMLPSRETIHPTTQTFWFRTAFFSMLFRLKM
jgi:hypothetical protein